MIGAVHISFRPKPSLILLLLSVIYSSESAFTPPSGVVYNTLESYLLSNGMQKCYDKPYSSATYESSFDACQGASWVFVGAKSSSSTSQLFMGAFGLASDVFRYTYDLSKGRESNGVYWYKVQSYAFGFSGVEAITLRYADIATSQSSTRLSWHYNSNNYGGWRAGSYDYLNSNGNFRKLIYMLPAGNGQPTMMPTASLPSCNVATASYLGDGYCDQGTYNTAACDYDRGDCCGNTCKDGLYTCGIAGYACLDPQGSTSSTDTPTQSPIKTPSISPTNAPISIQSTKAPSAVPSFRPTVAPTAPTYTPSNPPVCIPSTETPIMSPTGSPSISPTNFPTSIQSIMTPTVLPTAPVSGEGLPTSHPTSEPTALAPMGSPSALPTESPSVYVLSKFIQTFELDSTRPYLSGVDLFEAVQYENMTSYDMEDLYYTTITFSDNTKLRQGSDYITIFKDSSYSSVYGESSYSGVNFPGMNGAAALGFRDFRFVFHFHSSASDEIPADHGYQMTATITRYSKSSDVPSGTPEASSGETEGTYLGLSYAGFTAVFSVVITVSSFCCCCLLFWYRRAHSAAKIVAEEAQFDARIMEHREALKQSRMTAKKGKYSKKYSSNQNHGALKKMEESSNNSDALRENAPHHYLCPISSELMLDPVICSDGYTYDRQSIDLWLTTHGTSPMTNVPMSNEVMIPNLAVKETIQNYIASSNI